MVKYDLKHGKGKLYSKNGTILYVVILLMIRLKVMEIYL